VLKVAGVVGMVWIIMIGRKNSILGHWRG
jgi:hypothetical protein